MKSFRRRAIPVMILVAVLSATSSPAPSSAATTLSGSLSGVSAVSGSNAWAVGEHLAGGAVDTRVLHWNGSGWSKVESPNPSSEGNYLNGVSAVSGSNAWAVGYYYSPSKQGDFTLILHWNGKSWSKVNSPNPSSGYNTLESVSATSATNAWAVGKYQGGTNPVHTLILHWNGQGWSKVPSPSPGSGDNDLEAVSALSSTNAWAVGWTSNGGASHTLILHWNGSVWSRVPSPNPSSKGNFLDGVSVLSGSTAWAVGSYFGAGYVGRTLILRWNGTSWTRPTSPNPGTNANDLLGVKAIAPGNVWAVGNWCESNCVGPDAVFHTLIVHWNGKAWSKANAPDPHPSAGNFLAGVGASAGDDVWAVGQHGFGTLILHWNGSSWSRA